MASHVTANRNIIITGCSSGIGAYCARALLRDGWNVVASARQQADIDLLAADGIKAFHLDYADEASIDLFFNNVLEFFNGRIDALFNNGAYGQAGAVEDLPTQALRAQFEANLFGWHHLTRQVVPIMRLNGNGQGSGRIVQCSSILGVVPYKWRGAYNASKFALEGLSITLAMELEGSGIFVSLIEPGPIKSKFTTNGLAYFKTYIDMDASVHKEAYRQEVERLETGGGTNKYRLEPDAVYKVLDHALTSSRPKYHYPVTRPAKLGMMFKRILPSRYFYRFLAKQS